MNWRKAYQAFVESFGVPAFVEGNVPKDTAFPYATYTLNREDFSFETGGTIHLHYYTESEAVPSNKADEICDVLRKGHVIKCDEGALVLTTGSPEWLNVSDEDRVHKHRVINVQITFLLT